MDFDPEFELGSVISFHPETRDIMGVFKHADGGERRYPVVGWGLVAVEGSQPDSAMSEVVALFLRSDAAVLWTQQEMATMDLTLTLRWL